MKLWEAIIIFKFLGGRWQRHLWHEQDPGIREDQNPGRVHVGFC